MRDRWRRAVLMAFDLSYRVLFRRLIFVVSAQTAHHRMLWFLGWLDEFPPALVLLRLINRLAFERCSVAVGGVELTCPFVVAAGLVKGNGFDNERAAMQAVDSGQNIISGWRSVPQLTGPVEFGSFTRYPRLGNPGVVLWRDIDTRSTQNAVGLKNPGVCAAAAFLSKRRQHLPTQFGINIAISPGVDDPQQQTQELIESLAAFVDVKVIPTWFTLNLSCPNTEDDPGGKQTEALTRQLCSAAVNYLRKESPATPLWVKVGPDLAQEQYQILMQVFEETGVRAVIATNTLPRPAPVDTIKTAGVGGSQLHAHALAAASMLKQAQTHVPNCHVDVIGCGGILDGRSYSDFTRQGIPVVQYWSALIYRGPLAAAIIESEWSQYHARN